MRRRPAARATKSWTASSVASGGTGQMISPPTRSPSRLVARRRRPRAAAQELLGDLGGGPRSRARSCRARAAAPDRRSSRPAGSGRGGRAPTRSRRGRRLDRRREPARPGTRRTAGPRTRARATSSARRVLPTPPGPTSVTRRCSATRRVRSRSSSSRPTNGVSDSGMVERASTRPVRACRAPEHRGIGPGRGSPTPAGAARVPARARAPRRGCCGPPGRPGARRPAVRRGTGRSSAGRAGRSRSGCAATSSSSWTIAPWWRPSWSSRSSRSSITASRSSDRRVMAAAAKSS